MEAEKQHILVVDDDTRLRSLLTAFFARERFLRFCGQGAEEPLRL